MTELKAALVGESCFRVRFVETDAMGIVHHSSYIPWLEQARTDFCRTVGMSYPEISAKGIDFMVTELSVKYLSPSFFDNEIVVRAWVEKVGRVSCRFGYQIYNLTTGKICLGATTEHAAVNRDGKIQRMFPELYQLLLQHAGSGPVK